MSKKTDPTKPTPNKEKFAPQNVADVQSGSAKNGAQGHPADTDGKNIPMGSQPGATRHGN
ncbi:hypothetical protein HME9302_01416 [Alteripontixanthobacter maritimus]|uniref:Uncharacterized protein n=1 Tax=Alteripontixanthobacter maritimus TaxID=2161824 RepID=A0A369Q9I2_9SPHN|nr:hypothetical protein [Alteripontixanthobacter maritimus]RDC60215.1 hypothetical protein HME9302_01416 [Alteripontixanthobacter maritimus]